MIPRCFENDPDSNINGWRDELIKALMTELSESYNQIELLKTNVNTALMELETLKKMSAKLYG